VDKASGKSQSVKIEASTSLSKDEVERLKQEAAKHAEEDAQKKGLIEARNQAEAVVYAAEKALKEAGDKVPADVKALWSPRLPRSNRLKTAMIRLLLKAPFRSFPQRCRK
jgi:molecular chaperone DnaK (HSP70)